MDTNSPRPNTSNVTDLDLHEARWKDFLHVLATMGRDSYEKSNLSPEQFGRLFNELSHSGRIPLAMLTHAVATSEGKKAHQQLSHVLVACLALSMHFRELRIRELTAASIRLHLERESLFVFVLAHEVGPVSDLLGDLFEPLNKAFGDYLATFNEDVLKGRKG